MPCTDCTYMEEHSFFSKCSALCAEILNLSFHFRLQYIHTFDASEKTYVFYYYIHVVYGLCSQGIQTDTVWKTITKYYITMLMFGYYIFSITSIIAKLRTHEVFPERRMRASSVLTLTLHCTQKNWIFGSSIHLTEVKRCCIFMQRNYWF